MNYKQKIVSSPVYFSLQRIAHTIFNEWLESTKEFYNLSNEFYEKLQDEKVGEIFINNLAQAINTLINETSEDKQRIHGWSFGYVCGHLQGSINIEWINKYIIEPSEEFEELLKLKAIMALLNWDNDTSNKVFSIYKHFVKHRIQPTSPLDSMAQNVIQISDYKNIELADNNAFQKNIVNLLACQLQEKKMEMLEAENKDCCPDITQFLKVNDIRQIVGSKIFSAHFH